MARFFLAAIASNAAVVLRVYDEIWQSMQINVYQ